MESTRKELADALSQLKQKDLDLAAANLKMEKLQSEEPGEPLSLRKFSSVSKGGLTDLDAKTAQTLVSLQSARGNIQKVHSIQVFIKEFVMILCCYIEN